MRRLFETLPGPCLSNLPGLALALLLSLRALASEPAPSKVISSPSDTTARATLLVVIGAAGEEEFGNRFAEWSRKWERAAGLAGANLISIGGTNTSTLSDAGLTDLDRLKLALDLETKDGPTELWIVLIGHGTFDGRNARFNLAGPDFSDAELADWLAPFKRPVAVINTTSSSAPFLKALSAPGRVVLTATRSGNEQNFAYFGGHIADSIASPEADLDKDNQVSLLEAFLMAARKTAEFYDVEGRLATEHPLIDDNGDGLGTPADFFRGIRAVKKPAENAAVDGLRARQWHLIRSRDEARIPAELRARRDSLELQIEKLREEKAQLAEDEYYSKLEKLLLEVAEIYRSVEATPPAQP